MAKRPLDKSVKNPKGNYVFSDFSGGLYLLDTPRGIGEQLATLALVGGRNIWAERGALIPQYGYTIKGVIEDNEKVIAVSKDAQNSSSFFLVTISGTVYFYTAWQGLKKYKTTIDLLDTVEGNIVTARRGDNLVISDGNRNFKFGSYYEDAQSKVIEDDASVTTSNGIYIITAKYENKDYYWNTKKIEMSVGNDTVIPISITAVQVEVDNTDTITLRAVAINNGQDVSGEGNVTLSEKTIDEVSFEYQPEDTETGGGSVTIIPKLMNFANNRLIVADEQGRVFYSVVGSINDEMFSQARGAGYLQDFYEDISGILDFEDFLGGCLIFKENGIYFLKIEQTTLGTATNIQKVAQVGQQYATDHVIVREKVYAYDSNSGSIVIAAAQNVFGSLVAGRTIVTNEYLNSQDFCINDTKRFLTYNAENEVLILYYGENLNKGIVILDSIYSLFPRELDKPMEHFLGFNQGIAGITKHGEIIQDFKKGTVIGGLSAIANFEPIGLRDNRIICNSILEVTELNGINFNISLSNSGYSYQKINPSSGSGALSNGLGDNNIPLMLYSDYSQDLTFDRFSIESKWAGKQSSVTRVYAPMSGKEGISIGLEFPANEAFCLAALRLADFSQGE